MVMAKPSPRVKLGLHAETRNDPSMNVLFCDGHAAIVSCKQAYHAVSMNAALKN